MRLRELGGGRGWWGMITRPSQRLLGLRGARVLLASARMLELVQAEPSHPLLDAACMSTDVCALAMSQTSGLPNLVMHLGPSRRCPSSTDWRICALQGLGKATS